MTPTTRRLGPAVLSALALLVALGGGCHLIFPFSATALESDAGQTSDAMIDAAHADVALADMAPTDVALADLAPADMAPDQIPLEGGADARDLPAQDLLADQVLPYDQKTAPPCACSAADLNKDGKVDGADLAIFAGCLFKPATGACKVADTDSDGDVDGTDQVCLSAWMKLSCS